MMYGVQAYFVDCARAARRVSAISAGLAALLLAPLIALNVGPLREPLRKLLHARFGYEGPDQYVRRITLQQVQGSRAQLREIGAVNPRRDQRGGAVRARPSVSARARPSAKSTTIGPGMADADMMSRAVSRLANVPVVQSTALVIEHAAKPLYPDAELERGIEGKVMVQALVDTLGRVVDVQLLGTSGVLAFERSAAAAVWEYRFRPYRPGGASSEVYAIFRFVFRIY